jgi:hypothetical protein
MGVLRGGLSGLSLMSSCIIRPTGYVRCQFLPWDPLVCIYLSTSTCRSFVRSHHLMSSVVPQELFYFILTNIIIYYILFIPNWIKWLGPGLQYLVCAGHIKLWILFYFIILLFSWPIRDLNMSEMFYLLTPWLIQKMSGAIIWPLIGTDSLSFWLYIPFSFIDNYLLTSIWQLRPYIAPFVLLMWGRLTDSVYHNTCFQPFTLLGWYRPGRPNFTRLCWVLALA